MITLSERTTADIAAQTAECRLCPRECGAKRASGIIGSCGVAGTDILVAHVMLHRWEEPCISGSGGAGAVFFGGCGLRCIFCQNRKISHGGIGKYYGAAQLAGIFLDLQQQGADDIDLVTPTHYTPHIIAAVAAARGNGLKIPIVWNTSGYEKPETVMTLDGTADVYMTDFKYYSDELAARFSDAPDYKKYASASLRVMYGQTGDPRFNKEGIMTRGIIVRVLVLPGHTDDAMKIIHYLHREYGDGIYMSIMGQYTPPAGIIYPELSVPLGEAEYGEVTDFAEEIGVKNAYIQELTSISESFIPDFE